MVEAVRSFLVDCATAALEAPTAPLVNADDERRIRNGAQRLLETVRTAVELEDDAPLLPIVDRLGAGTTELGSRMRTVRGHLPWAVSPRGHDAAGLGTGLVLFNKALDLSPLTVGLMVLASGATYPEHTHPPQELYFIVDGTASWRFGGAATYVDLEPGVVLFNHPNDRHGTVAGVDPLIAMYVLWEGDPT